MRRDEFPIIDKYVEQERNKVIGEVLKIIDEKNKRIYTEHKNLGTWERGYTDALEEVEEAVTALGGVI